MSNILEMDNLKKADILQNPSEEITQPETPVNAYVQYDYIVNTNTGKFHYPSCSSVEDIKDKNRWDYTGSRDELISQGYVPCKRCNP